ncbi:hypothetical protein HRbin36_01593 [bacterium HR36]|nr:hypothetical protein HRbin36_01593 [bacterium HR36]
MSAELPDDTKNASSSAPSARTWNEPPRAMSVPLSPSGADRPVRHELVARVRRAIQAGTYETPEKWAITVRRLLEILTAPATAPLQANSGRNSASREMDNTFLRSPPIPPRE